MSICTIYLLAMPNRRWRRALTPWKVQSGKLWHAESKCCLGLELRRARGSKTPPPSSVPTGTNSTNSTKTDSSKDRQGRGFQIWLLTIYTHCDFIKHWLTVFIQQGVGRTATASGRSLFQIRRWWRSGWLARRVLWNWARVSQQHTDSTSG